MEESSPDLKYERRWQLGIYALSILSLARDVFFGHHDYGFTYITDLFDTFRPYFLFVALPLLGISWFLVLKSPHLGARIAIAAATLSFTFYLGMFVINLINGPYFLIDVIRFYIPRIFLIEVTFIYSHKILQLPSEQTDFFIPIFFLKLHWTARLQRHVILVSMIMFGILGIQWLYPRASCATQGGQWIIDGIFGQAQYCLYEYPDAGQACQSSEDCMGACLVPTDSSGSLIAAPTAGVCASDNRAFGCFFYFEHQKISGECVD